MSGTRIALIAASLVAAGVVSSAQAINNARIEDQAGAYRTVQPQYGPSAYAQLGRIYAKVPRIPLNGAANENYWL